MAMEAPRSGLDVLRQAFGRDRLWRELDHQLAAAGHDPVLVERIEGLLAFLPDIDQTRIAQDGKMMGDGGLADIELIHNLTDRKFATATHAHDFLACVI